MTSSSEPDFPGPVLRPVQRRRRFGMARVVMALVLREMQTTYGRSPGGYIWAVLEPAAGIALLSFIFSFGFRAPPLGNDFVPFYATGVVPYIFYSDLSGKLAGSLNFSRQLLSYPSVTFVDTIIARLIVNALTQLMVSYVVFTAILLMFDTQSVLRFDRIVMGYVMVIALSTGVGVMNCFLQTAFPVWQRIWAVANRPMFLISGIFFLFQTVPQPYRDYLWYNPLVHVIGMVRSGFYSSYDAPYVSVGYVMGLSLGLTVMGLVFLRRYHRDILNR